MAKIRINGDTSGYIEISAPAVAGSTSITLPATTGGSLLATDASGNLNVDSGTFYIDGTNNRVGIGTTSPLLLLQLNSAAATNSTLAFSENGTLKWYNRYNASDGSFQIVDVVNTTTRLHISNTGNVGIGTTSPGSILHLSSSSNEYLRIQNTTAGNSIYLGNASGTGVIQVDGANSFKVITNGSDRLIVNSSGNVGIGTTSVKASLDIGTSAVASAQANTLLALESTVSSNWIEFCNSGTTNNAGIQWSDAGSSDNASIYYDNNTGNLLYKAEGSQVFRTNGGNERARIDSSGRLLVGTSTNPSAGDGQFGKIVVQGYTGSATGQGYMSIARGQAATSIVSGDDIGSIVFTESTGYSFARIVCQADAAPGTNDYPGRLVFSTTADGASSPTERARINNAGEFSFRNTSYVFPATDNAVSLGLTGFRFSAVWAANGTIQTSDERAKADITDAALGSEFIKALRPVSYKWIEGGKRDTGERDEDENYIYESVPGTRTHWGFIAQEVKEAVDAAGVDFGGWVLTDKDDPDSQQALRYDQFIAPLTKALQETMAELEALKAEVAALKAQ